MKNKTPLSIPSSADIAAVANPEIADATQAEALVRAHQITAIEGTRTAVTWIAEIKMKREEVDAKRRSFVDPLKKVISDIDAFFKPALERLDAAEREMKAKIIEFTTASLAERDRVLGAVSDAAPEEQTALVKRAEALTPPRVDGLSVRDNWTGEVQDAELLKAWAIENGRLELLQVNEKALIALTKAAGADPKVPGWLATNKRIVAVTAGRVKS